MIALLSAFSSTGPAMAQDADTFEQSHQDLTEQNDLQWEMDTREAPEYTPPPEPVQREPMPEWLAGMFKVIFWVAIGLAGLAIVYFVAMEIARKKFGFGEKRAVAETPDAPQYYRAEAEEVKVLLDEADQLAAEGRYGEAVHVILYRSIANIEAARPREMRRSLTSREISHLDILSAASRESFNKLVRTVEVSFFGGANVSKDDYIASRQAYNEFVDSGYKEVSS